MLRKRLYPIAIVLVVCATIGATWVIAEEASDPHFRADAYSNIILGYDWTVGSTVHLTIDDPYTEPEVDYEDWLVVPDGTPFFAGANVSFALDREVFQLAAGQLVTLDDGTVEKVLTVTSLSVTLVDPDTDAISGTADPGAQVTAYAHGDGGEFAQRFPIADAGGYWLADFSEPGDETGEEDVLDIAPSLVCFWVYRFDADEDSTAIFWPYDPRFEVRRTFEQVWSTGWLEEATVTLSIYDSEGTQLLYTDSQVAAPSEWEWYAISADFDLRGIFQIEPGQIVRMDDGVSFKEHVVQDLAVTNVDVGDDVVMGSATPYADLVVNVWQGSQTSRQVEADNLGLWVADFSDPEGGDVYDIDEETTGAVFDTDDDSDSTVVDWSARVRVAIDIKPGSSPNSLNLDSKGVIAVALLTTEYFDASTADPATVQFAGATPLRWSSKDVDSDGDLDLLFQVKTPELGLDADSTVAILRGETFGGRPFVGWDSVNIVP